MFASSGKGIHGPDVSDSAGEYLDRMRALGRREGFEMILVPLVMILPIIGLWLFRILPFGQALPIYLSFILLFAGMMWVMRSTMNQPRETGAESLLGETAEVVFRSSLGYGAPYMVRILGEVWSADSDEVLHVGETVRIVSLRGNRVQVRRGPAKCDN